MPKGNREFYSQLIQEVQARECLYNPGHPQYKDRLRLDAEWGEIGQILGVSGNVAKKTWQNLRSSYSRCLTGNKSMNGSSGKSTWYLKEQMDFLRDHMTCSSMYDPSLDQSDNLMVEDMGQSPDEMVDMYIKEEERELEDSTNDSATSSSFLSVHPVYPVAKKPKITLAPLAPPSNNAMADAFLKYISSDVDEDLLFFKGILPNVKQLNARNNRKFKHAIANYLFELLEDQETPLEETPKSVQT
ncbi:transcription factor Adf-1-like [Physella acuta]|uniref:transcription factor Adf-1-like n=1 Tax=Physella acuta TaxID=109671 RepID=UPI0027DBAB27|nr:transcription factor Adf-1-like [Physella acuta]